MSASLDLTPTLDSCMDTTDCIVSSPALGEPVAEKPVCTLDPEKMDIDRVTARVVPPAILLAPVYARIGMTAEEIGRHPDLHRGIGPGQARQLLPTSKISLAMSDAAMVSMTTVDSIDSQLKMYYEQKSVPATAQLDYRFVEMVVRTTAATLQEHGCLVTASGTLLYTLATLLTFMFLPMRSVMCLIRGQGCSQWYWHGPPAVLRLRGGAPLSGMADYEASSDDEMPVERQPGEAVDVLVPVVTSAQGEAAAAGTSVLPAANASAPAPAPVVVPAVVSPGSQSGTVSLAAINKHLMKAIQVPTAESWNALHPTVWCTAMDRYLSVTGITDDFDAVVKLVWTVLPPAVRLAVVPRAAVLSYRGDTAGMWDGLEAFPTWSALRAAILAHFLPLAQEKHVNALFALQLKPGNGRQYREKFLQHCAMLDEAFMPNDAQLLRHLKATQYARLASVASVFMNGTARWLPKQWPALLDAMVDADVVLAETTVHKVVGVAQAADPTPSRTPAGAAWQPAKSRKRKGSGSANPPAKRSSGAGPSGSGSGSSRKGEPSLAKDRFLALKWKDPAVQAAADQGKCINCLQDGHFARECPKPKVHRARVATGIADGKGKAPKNV